MTVVGQTDGIGEDDRITNYAVGHMMGGFDGMLHADLLNESRSAETVFRVFYCDGTFEDVRTRMGSSAWEYYAALLSGDHGEK